MTQDVLIDADALHKHYTSGSTRSIVLAGASMAVHAGELVAIVGRSGSGKSTLLNLLAGLDRPDAGTVRFRGQDLARLSDTVSSRIRRESFGFVFQAFNLIPTLTVRENLILPLALSRRMSRRTREQTDALLRDIGLGEAASRFPEELSGGEQQRLAIARAIAHEPEVVFADEPTGNLDLETARRTLALLERYTIAAGRTLIMATHSSEMIGHAHRVVEISDRIVRSV